MTDEPALMRDKEITTETPRVAVEDLLVRVYAIPGRRKVRAWLIPITATVAFGIVMAALGAVGYLESGWPAFAAFLLTFGSGIWVGVWAERRDMRTVCALAACQELRALGGLLNSINYGNRRVKSAVQNALLELLPHLTEDSQIVFSTGNREALNALLYGKSGELAMAALRAIEQVGDGTALPYLTSISAGKGIPSALRNQQAEVQERARRALETIHARIEMHNRAGTLLRASQIPVVSTNEMLRPAGDPLVTNQLVNSQELLRPEISAEQDAIQEDLAGLTQKENIVD